MLKLEKFYTKGIEELPYKWYQVIANVESNKIVLYFLRIKMINKNGNYL